MRQLASWARKSISTQRRTLKQTPYTLENIEPITNSPEYITWSVSHSSDILWYAGPPSVGKTTLARYIALNFMDNLHDGHQLEVVHFFCSTAKSELRWNPLSTTPDILRSLIGQLLDHDIGRITTTQDILRRSNKQPQSHITRAPIRHSFRD